ncbi:hypothetical protein R3Q06_32295 [Rhodococcus erythropolis]|uniref:hypothetical protein n=1 Tax=Rhodococcus erythropolis TaxID=1833 RepID=UPI00294937DD|nr:hypothetical protein [Rhodococcus erythropolis]MDV6278154.1 hypothetical protein [Rhodococcus erythropolis]
MSIPGSPAHEGDGWRLVGGGAADWASITVDGNLAHATGRDEAWLSMPGPLTN